MKKNRVILSFTGSVQCVCIVLVGVRARAYEGVGGVRARIILGRVRIWGFGWHFTFVFSKGTFAALGVHCCIIGSLPEPFVYIYIYTGRRSGIHGGLKELQCVTFG